MKVVINACYGGFSLSPAAIKRYAELKGRKCYFFTMQLSEGRFNPVTMDEAGSSFVSHAFDTPNPNDWYVGGNDYHALSDEEKAEANALYAQHSLDNRDIDRGDPDLVKVVKELGDKASGAVAKLKIVEIPDNVEWQISEYDGFERVEETHRTWG